MIKCCYSNGHILVSQNNHQNTGLVQTLAIITSYFGITIPGRVIRQSLVWGSDAIQNPDNFNQLLMDGVKIAAIQEHQGV